MAPNRQEICSREGAYFVICFVGDLQIVLPGICRLNCARFAGHFAKGLQVPFVLDFH